MFTRGTHLYRRLYCQTKPSSSSLSSHFSQSSNSSWTSLSSRSFLIGLPLFLQLRSWGFCLTFHSREFQILCQFLILWWGQGGLWWHWQLWWQFFVSCVHMDLLSDNTFGPQKGKFTWKSYNPYHVNHGVLSQPLEMIRERLVASKCWWEDAKKVDQSWWLHFPIKCLHMFFLQISI